MRKERRLRVFEKRMPRRIYGPKRDEVTGRVEKNDIMRSLMICTAQPNIVRVIKSKRMRWRGM
jgi:hypothetical protein